MSHGEIPDLDAREVPGMRLSREFVTIGQISFPINRGENRETIGLFKDHDDFEANAKIYSPVASFCAGKDQFVHVKNRPLFYDKLINIWTNFGDDKERRIQDEIE